MTQCHSLLTVFDSCTQRLWRHHKDCDIITQCLVDVTNAVDWSVACVTVRVISCQSAKDRLYYLQAHRSNVPTADLQNLNNRLEYYHEIYNIMDLLVRLAATHCRLTQVNSYLQFHTARLVLLVEIKHSKTKNRLSITLLWRQQLYHDNRLQ